MTKGRAAVQSNIMKLKVIVHEAEEGGFWSEVLVITGCATQGDTFEELLENLHEAVEGCLSGDVQDISVSEKHRVMEIAVSSPSVARVLPAFLNGMAGN